MKETIAKLTINNHENLTVKELNRLKKWLKTLAEEVGTYKRGELDKKFYSTLYK